MYVCMYVRMYVCMYVCMYDSLTAAFYGADLKFLHLPTASGKPLL
jgi:hypothetical protein